jgi:hypothetical protein
MIEVAIADWRAGVRYPDWTRRGKLSAEARDWLFNPARRALVKFEDACAVFNVDADWMRARILSEYATDGVSNSDGD